MKEYNKKEVNNLIEFIIQNDGINDKTKLANLVQERFDLVKDRKVFYCEHFALRFSSSNKKSFGNTVLSLSKLQKYDDRPVIICLVLPSENYLLMANSTCLKKVSHSSQQLRIDNIKGSFNGSDIMRVIGTFDNTYKNFEDIFAIHQNYTFEDNLERLVESTNNIVARMQRFEMDSKSLSNIMEAPQRSLDFINSEYYKALEKDLYKRIKKVEKEIIIAGFIDNVKTRGNIIEYLITDNGSNKKNNLINCLQNNEPLPSIKLDNDLGDYNIDYIDFKTKTDIKTKVMFLKSNPKAYNIDKLLEFLSKDKSVYMIYFVGINEDESISTVLCPLYHKKLLKATVIMKHWAGRNSRGVAQFYGDIIKEIIENFNNDINLEQANRFNKKLISI